MELSFIDLAGIAFFSLLFYVYLLVSKQKDRAMRFISMYFFVFFTGLSIVLKIVEEPSFVQMVCKTLFPLLFVVLYPIAVRHKLSVKEKNMLIFILFIGIIPLLMTWMVVVAFWLFGQNM